MGTKVKFWNPVGKEMNEATKNADGDWNVKSEDGFDYTWDNADFKTVMKPLFKAPFVGTEKGKVSHMTPPGAEPGDPLAKLTGGAESPGAPGWVELDDGNIFVVNYITDDAPKPYIKWYLINEDMFG